MNQIQLTTKVFQEWSIAQTQAAHSSIPLDRLIEQFALDETSFRDYDNSISFCQTGYCYSLQMKTAVYAASKQWIEMANQSDCVSLIFCPSGISQTLREIRKPIFESNRSSQLFHQIHNEGFHKNCYQFDDTNNIHPSAKIHDTAVIGNGVYIDEGVTIGPQAVISGPCYIGPGSRVDELVTVGSKGLFAKKIEGRLREFRYYGGVEIGENSHLHARSNVAASPHFRSLTRIGSNVSIGISSNVGHDCQIGDDSVISSTGCVCGRSVIGNNCWIGAGAIVSDGCRVESDAKVRIGAVVVNDVGEGCDVSGNFAIKHMTNVRIFSKHQK